MSYTYWPEPAAQPRHSECTHPHHYSTANDPEARTVSRCAHLGDWLLELILDRGRPLSIVLHCWPVYDGSDDESLVVIYAPGYAPGDWSEDEGAVRWAKGLELLSEYASLPVPAGGRDE